MKDGMFWIYAEFAFLANFVLKPSDVSHTSGKTLLLPTPYAIKMALLDRAIRIDGIQVIDKLFPIIRDLKIFWDGPKAIGVTQLLDKVRKFNGRNLDESIIMQEYCTYSSAFRLLIGPIDNMSTAQTMANYLKSLSYLGRNSSIISCHQLEIKDDSALTHRFIDICEPLDLLQPPLGMVQRMDDMLRRATFDDVSTYNLERKARLETRNQYDIIIPYRLIPRSDGFVAYIRREA
jgi:hypothetical protein